MAPFYDGEDEWNVNVQSDQSSLHGLTPVEASCGRELLENRYQYCELYSYLKFS